MGAFLFELGIHPQDLFAGFAGGLVAALVTAGPRPHPWNIFCSVVVGGGVGGYLGPLFPAWMPVWMGIKPSPGASFGTGVAGMPLCKGIILAVQRIRWSKEASHHE